MISEFPVGHYEVVSKKNAKNIGRLTNIMIILTGHN